MEMEQEKDRAELDKYIKFFCLKAVELIYSCRQKNSGPVLQEVNPNSRPWFNVHTPEAPEIARDVKRVLDRQLPSPQQSLIIQTSIVLPSNNSKVVIESWKISCSDDCDKNVKLIAGVYTKLATMLKSILCISRNTAAYKFCRENRSFKVETEFYFGEVSSSLLDGVCDKPRRLGTVPTPYNSISVTVFCRHIKQIELLISSQRSHFNLQSNVSNSSSRVGGRGEDENREGAMTVGRKLSREHSNPEVSSPPSRKVPEFPITPAFAAQPVLSTKDLLTDIPFDRLFSQPFEEASGLKPTQEIADKRSVEDIYRTKFQPPNFFVKSNRSSGSQKSSLSRKNSNSRPGSLEMSQPAFISPTDSIASHQKTDSSSSSADVEGGDVSQFFRMVQQASCLRSNDPHEGHVISHNMQLGDYVTSFNDIEDELKKLVTVFNNE